LSALAHCLRSWPIKRAETRQVAASSATDSSGKSCGSPVPSVLGGASISARIDVSTT
jgi:hypothetical protein